MANQLIFAVEDDEGINELYECSFVASGFNVKTFFNAEEMLKEIENVKPDLIILDLMLPQMSGLDALKILKKNAELCQIPVIIISAKGEETSKVKGLNLGADDYIAKPFGIMELVARVNAILRRSSKKSVEEIYFCRDIKVDVKKHLVLVGEKQVLLTPKEFFLLVCLIRKQGEVIKRDCLLNEVWGEEYFGETRTLDIHIKSLRQKLKEQSGCDDYIETFRGIGYSMKNDI